MSGQRWPPEELLQKASVLAGILMGHESVSGVALSGSLARLEPRVYDIDLVVFHDGSIGYEGVASASPRAHAAYHRVAPLITVIREPTPKLLPRLEGVRREVPLDCTFLCEHALWDCAYLQHLDHEDGARGYYKTILCQIPLLLFSPQYCRGELGQWVQRSGSHILRRFGHKPACLKQEWLVAELQHRCGNAACRPTESWEERRAEIMKRKGHSH